MRVLIRWTLLVIVLGLGLAPSLAIRLHAAPQHRPSQREQVRISAHHLEQNPRSRRRPAVVSLKVASGYQESYRASAWMPIRVTVRNHTANTVNGAIDVPDPSATSSQNGPPLPYRVLYQTPVVLAADVTKEVTLYVPGTDLPGAVTVEFRDAGQVLATASDVPNSWDQNTVSIGALSSDAGNLGWIRRLNDDLSFTTDLTRLTPDTFDPLSQALANFDLIAITDGSISSLDAAQLGALDQYVRDGGGLILVGGPGWQETLRPLPSDLVPGTLSGTRTLSSLRGLRSIEPVAAPRHEAAAVVSVLLHPRGTVLASENGVPLVVQSALGSGTVMYLAFDPTLDPVAHWGGAQSILDRLLLRTAPAAAARAGSNTASQGSNFGAFPASTIATELSNVPAAGRPSIVLFLVLALLYIVLLGPVNFFVLRRLHRQALLWITVPLGSILCLGATYAAGLNLLRSDAVLVNTVGMVTLDNTPGPQPAVQYMGLFAPVRGNYTLTYNGTSLPQFISAGYSGVYPSGKPPVGLQLQEGGQTAMSFFDVNMWSMRDAEFHTSVTVHGRIQSRLRVDRDGSIVGGIENGTSLTLIHPVVVAGRATLLLPDMPPEKTVAIRITPHFDIYNQNNTSLWSRVYGQPRYTGPPATILGTGIYGFCAGSCVGLGRMNFCCSGTSPPAEHTLSDRIRDTVAVMPDAQDVSQLGEVLFTAWTEQPLVSLSVDGSAPVQRNLNLVVSPLSVGIDRGAFAIRTGTFGAHLVDVSPAQGSGSNCCGSSGPDNLDIGTGGSATFEFDLPAAHRLHFHHLWLHVDAGGASGTTLGRVWDWRTGRWTGVDLSQGYAELTSPDRFVSSGGAVVLRLVNANDAGLFGASDIRIEDIHRNLQISGDGVAT